MILNLKNEKSSVFIIVIILIIISFIIYNSMPSKYTKLEEIFGGFLDRCVVRFGFEKSSIHTIFHGGTGTVKTYFVRHYSKLYGPPTSTEGLSPDTYKESYCSKVKTKQIEVKYIDISKHEEKSLAEVLEENMMTK